MNYIPDTGHQYFVLFKTFFKMEVAFLYCKNVFSISFIRLVQTDFLPSGNSIFLVRAIFLLVETIIGIRRKQFSKKEIILVSGQLIFWLVETTFSTKSLIPTSGNGFSGQWKPFSFVQRFLFQVETVTLSESQFSDQWKPIFWLVETIFFHSISESSQLLPVKAVYSSTRTYFSANPSFRLMEAIFLSTGNSIVLFRSFFCQWKLLLKFGGSQFLKANYPANGHKFFSIFPDIF